MNEIFARFPGFLQKVKTAAIEAKLRAAAEPEPPSAPTAIRPAASPVPAAAPVVPKVEIKENEQPELDFGF